MNTTRDVTAWRLRRRKNFCEIEGITVGGNRVLLGMSGGVDSTYAVMELRAAGFSVEGAVLKMSEWTDISGAERAAAATGVPLHVIECTDRFRSYVIENFVSEYAAARTPNPCVVCNRFVKIAALCEFAAEHGFSRVATGHYAGVARDAATGRFYIVRASDPGKDQSYVLWRLTQEQLSMLVFPLCGRYKTEVREQAKTLALPSAEAPDSQEICFIPDNDYVSYIEAAAGKFPEGRFIDADGAVLGTHKGIIHYTIGQRKGLGISLGRPMFVSAMDPVGNTVTLADEKDIFSDRLVCDALNFMRLTPGNYDGLRLDVKIRYSAKRVPATVRIFGNRAEALFEDPVRAATPGQSAVFYEGDCVMLGGMIGSS